MKTYDTLELGEVFYTVDQGIVVKCSVRKIHIKSDDIIYDCDGESCVNDSTGALKISQQEHIIEKSIAKAIEKYLKKQGDNLIRDTGEYLSCNVNVDVPF